MGFALDAGGSMTEKLLVLTWLWTQAGGRATYTARHVNIWADMIGRHLDVDHEVACVTDMPEGINPRVRIIPPPGDFVDVEIPTWRHGRPRCHRRLALFRPDAAELFGADRVLNCDLDVVVCDALAPLLGGGEDFRIARGTASSRAFNGSLFMLRLGSRPRVYTEFTPERAAAAGQKHVGSDQSWMAKCLAGEKTWGPEDGVVWWHQRYLAPKPRMVTFPGELKPWSLVDVGDRFVSRHYRADPAGTGLLLGYAPSLWSDLDIAVGRPFDGVIASPEAARHWPGPLLAIAHDDDHAERLAAMHGLDDIVFCGRTTEDANGAAR